MAQVELSRCAKSASCSYLNGKLQEEKAAKAPHQAFPAWPAGEQAAQPRRQPGSQPAPGLGRPNTGHAAAARNNGGM
eukprot:scaffold320236_cov41-Prasinocladus_malaysianus.AAC.1